MGVAALYDIHGNLPALEAVLEDVARVGADRVVVGGDVTLGPMPRETLERLLALHLPVDFIQGNCERAALAQIAAADPDAVTEWGTASGRPMPEPYRSQLRWAALEVRDYESLMASWPLTVRIEIDGLGSVVFCHATPRNSTEIFTRETSEARLLRIFDEARAAVVVCGHTHMQFDRRVGGTRVINAGSVGSPFGRPGAAWALLGPGVELRHVDYDVQRTAELVRRTAFPFADEAAHRLLEPEPEAEMLAIYAGAELTP